jgi:ribosomal protein S27E
MDCNDYLYQDQMSSDLICYECETCFEKYLVFSHEKDTIKIIKYIIIICLFLNGCTT